MISALNASTRSRISGIVLQVVGERVQPFLGLGAQRMVGIVGHVVEQLVAARR